MHVGKHSFNANEPAQRLIDLAEEVKLMDKTEFLNLCVTRSGKSVIDDMLEERRSAVVKFELNDKPVNLARVSAEQAAASDADARLARAESLRESVSGATTYRKSRRASTVRKKT